MFNKLEKRKENRIARRVRTETKTTFLVDRSHVPLAGLFFGFAFIIRGRLLAPLSFGAG